MNRTLTIMTMLPIAIENLRERTIVWAFTTPVGTSPIGCILPRDQVRIHLPRHGVDKTPEQGVDLGRMSLTDLAFYGKRYLCTRLMWGN
jgi:hypothetical protein